MPGHGTQRQTWGTGCAHWNVIRRIVGSSPIGVAEPSVRDLTVRIRQDRLWLSHFSATEFARRRSDSVRREVAEETGVDVAVERLTGAYKKINRGSCARLSLLPDRR